LLGFTSPLVRQVPEIKQVPAASDQLVWLVPGVQTWHEALGFVSPLVRQVPAMRQVLPAIDQAVCVRAGSHTWHEALGFAWPVVRQVASIKQQVAPQQIACARSGASATSDSDVNKSIDQARACMRAPSVSRPGRLEPTVDATRGALEQGWKNATARTARSSRPAQAVLVSHP
jgi:hypothetical protein